MMRHPASDISKVLKTKRNLKTKKNFQFKFNNFRRENGSVATVLSAEENTFAPYSQNTKENWCKVGKEILKPCSVQLTRLSQIELVSCGYKRVSRYNRNIKVNNLVNEDCDTNSTMKKSVGTKSTKSSVDKTQLHLELEKVASTFASEVKAGTCFQYEDYFDNPANFALARKEKVSKVKVAQKPDRGDKTNGVLKESVDNVTHKSRLRKRTVKKLSATVDDYTTASDSDEGEWLGWNSKVTPLDKYPGVEIVSIKENKHIENIINWNMKIDTESDMDVEEVFLLTDLIEIKHNTASAESVNYSSHEGWPGWPEQKSTALCYVFNV